MQTEYNTNDEHTQKMQTDKKSTQTMQTNAANAQPNDHTNKQCKRMNKRTNDTHKQTTQAIKKQQ